MSLCVHNNLFSHCTVCSGKNGEVMQTALQSLNLFTSIHSKNKHRQRFGQLFCNMFFKDGEAIPGLFYETNEGKAREMVRKWLLDNQYIFTLPPVRNEVYKDFMPARGFGECRHRNPVHDCDYCKETL